MRSFLMPSLFCLAALVASTAAEAGVKITIEETMGAAAQPRSNTVLLQPDRMAMGTPRGRMIFRDDLQTAWIVNDGQRRYFEMNAQSLQQAQAAMQAAMEKMQAELKSMPADQRKQVEAMMAAQGMSPTGQDAGPPPITYRRLGQSRTVGQWSCEMFEQQVNGQKQADFCAARLTTVGLTRGDLKAFRDFFRFTQKGMPQASRRRAQMVDFDALSKAAGYDAIPLDVTGYDNDRQVSHSVVRSVERSDIPAATFELPAGYTKEEIPRPGGGQN
jgi:hypothetical protein